jgi:ribosomal protein L29
MLKPAEIRKMSTAELIRAIERARAKVREFTWERARGVLPKDVNAGRKARRELARLLTIARERALAQLRSDIAAEGRKVPARKEGKEGEKK